MIYCQGPSVKGISGSPLISRATGNVVGIVSIKLTGISDSLEDMRKTIRTVGDTVVETGPNGERFNVGGSVLQNIDILDRQLANGLSSAVGIYGPDAAPKDVQRQKQ